MEPASAPRKRRFIPKAPPRRAPKQEVKAEPDQGGDENDDEQARELLKRFNEASIRKPRVEKKAVPIQAAFGYGATSTSMKSFGDPKGSNDANASAVKEEKEYSSPFDQNSYYPITLPLRPPYSGNPEIRDKEEFGEGLEESTYDENSTAPANDLGLMEENKATSMLFFKFLPTVPIVKRSATTESHEVQKDAGLPGGVHNIPKPSSLSDLPPGFMGKMQVYKSGAIKLKLGDTLFHVNPGMNCDFAQDAVVINKAEKSCTILGEVNKRAILTPDISSVLNSIDGLSL